MARFGSILTPVVLVVAIDQATKAYAASASIDVGWIDPVSNPDALLGLITGSQTGLLALGVATLVAFGSYLGYLVRSGLAPWIAGLLIGGALSNLVDRALIGEVRDFLRLPELTVNIADIALLVGVLALLAHHHQGRKQAAMSSTAESGVAAGSDT